MEKDIPTNRLKKNAGVNILISNKIHFKPKLTRRDREEHYIHIKGKLHSDDI